VKSQPDFSDVDGHLTEDDILLTRAEAARDLRRSISTLERWARDGTGPLFKKVGGRVLYALRTLRSYAGVKVR
jgi:hypothetical protein